MSEVERGEFELVVDGQVERVEAVDAATSLLDWLRATGRTGTKEGCAEGDCGACTVGMLDRRADGRAAWRGVCACITPLATLADRELVTVQGLADTAGAAPGAAPELEQLHPVQRAMVRNYGSQCGFCTPGFVMSMFEGYCREDLPAAPAPGALSDQLCGNLCRCTGYRPIREAMLEALQERTEDRFTARQGGEVPPLRSLDYAAGGSRVLRPTTLKALLEALAAHPEGELVAGATEIGVYRNKRFQAFPLLISTEGVAELGRVRCGDGGWELGGGATLTCVEEALGEALPSLRKMIRVFASRQIRNRATVAGNLVTASPIGDLAPVLLSLEAEVVLASAARGERVVPLADFFVGYRETVRARDEVLVRVVVPAPALEGDAREFVDSYKVSKRRELDIAIVSAGFRVVVDADGRVARARLAYGGVAAMPARAEAVEEALVGESWGVELGAQVREALVGAFTPLDDVRGGAAFRRDQAAELFAKFVAGARSEAMEGDLGFVVDRTFAETSLKQAARFELPHESGVAHVTGRARYVDDEVVARPGVAVVWPVLSTIARGTLARVDAEEARGLPGVLAVLSAAEVPGANQIGALRPDEPLFAEDEVNFQGQLIAAVVAETIPQARAAAARVRVELEPLEPVLGVDAALAREAYHTEPHVIARGSAAEAIARAPRRLTGRVEIGGQEHFYLESHAAWAEVGDDGDVRVHSSTQHPSEVQAVISHVLGVSANRVVVTSPRMGGGFGGKETQANGPAAVVALAAWRTGRTVKWMLDRDVDMALTGKRHPFQATWSIGFEDDGTVVGFDALVVNDAGFALDLSGSINDRALFHIDNAYYLPSLRVEGRVARTNVCSHTAFRGFGGPQGMVVIEDAMDAVARSLGLPPEEVRRRNLYRGTGETATTHYGQALEDPRIERLWDELVEEAQLGARRAEIAAFNATHAHVKRGIAITPVKFGISFTASFLNQAGALVLLYKDGTAQVNHGGTEMGQGLYTKILGVAMAELGLPASAIRVMQTQTDKVPNTSATAASSGSDLNGAAVADACQTLRARLVPVAAELLGVAAEAVRFEGGEARGGGKAVAFAEVTTAAWLQQVSLSATGFYATPGLSYDKGSGRGKPFHYFAWGAAVSEVEVDGHTGMKRIVRVDVLHDVGSSLHPSVDRGQIEGAFVQGAGWLTSEELRWSEDGRLLSHSASTYAIPTIGDAPAEFRVRLLRDAEQSGVIHGSKAVGEPPFMLAISVREALKDAVAAFGPGGAPVELGCPATHEAIRAALVAQEQAE